MERSIHEGGAGPLENLLGMRLGTGGLKAASMTPEERRHPEILDGRRKCRIVYGSPTQVKDVNRLPRQFEELQRMMRDVGGLRRRLRHGGMGPGLPGSGSELGSPRLGWHPSPRYGAAYHFLSEPGREVSALWVPDLPRPKVRRDGGRGGVRRGGHGTVISIGRTGASTDRKSIGGKAFFKIDEL